MKSSPTWNTIGHWLAIKLFLIGYLSVTVMSVKHLPLSKVKNPYNCGLLWAHKVFRSLMSYLIYASSILHSIKGYFTSSNDLSSISMLDTKCGQNLQNWLSQLTLSQQWFSDIFIDSNPFIYNMCTEVSFHIFLNVFLPKMVFLFLPVPTTVCDVVKTRWSWTQLLPKSLLTVFNYSP